jgi:hypothetical protein|tara:strand:- start:5983 stop:7020 length:1038 start_codon:yes stop_codon:yes gene_type:complete
MKKHSAFPKIGQFRQVVKEAQLRSSYTGKDENGDPIYDHNITSPTIKFKGTVKLHGTNAGIGHTQEDGLWSQSRGNIITPEEDNFGFARYVEDHKQAFLELIEHVRYNNSTTLKPNDGVFVFGEWAGKGIQKVESAGISQNEKSFFIFDVKVVPEDGTEPYHLPSNYLQNHEHRIFNIEDFLCYEIDIDFNRPDLVQNELSDITIAVEELCPVAKHFGFEGIGEGVVWVAQVNGHDYRFKVKGEKHSVSKVKTLAKVDTEKMNSIHEFVDYAATENRYEQGMGIVFPDRDLIDIKKMGDIIRWVVTDIMVEEKDTLESNGLEPKDVNKHVSKRVREMFFVEYNKV